MMFLESGQLTGRGPQSRITMLHPLLLWFLPLAAVPLLLHLITLYRLAHRGAEHVPLSDGQLHPAAAADEAAGMAVDAAANRLRGADRAHARPGRSPRNIGFLFGGSSGRDVVLIVDAGVTSGLQTAGSSALKRGKEAAAVVAKKLAPADYVTLIRAGIAARAAVSRLSDRRRGVAREDRRDQVRHRHGRSGGRAGRGNQHRPARAARDVRHQRHAAPQLGAAGRSSRRARAGRRRAIGGDERRQRRAGAKTWPCWAIRRGRSGRSSICRCCSRPRSPPASTISRSARASAWCWTIRSSGS